MASKEQQLLGIAGIAAALVAYTFATPDSAHARFYYNPPRGAPEVDPSTISSVVALALGGFAVLGDKLRRR